MKGDGMRKGRNRIDRQELTFILLLVLISAVLYIVHFLIFRNAEHIGLFALGDLAFVPKEVIFVSLIFHRALASNERRKKLSKLYMVIELFFSEVGAELLRLFSANDTRLSEIQQDLNITDDWKDKDFKRLMRIKECYQPDIVFECGNMQRILTLLTENRGNMVRMLENPALLEHETFTELLMAVFHLCEELSLRDDLTCLPDEDMAHIAKDAKRAYILLGIEWVDYIAHMHNHYPYLFSLAIRMNPFGNTRRVVFGEDKE